ncbi:MAG: hypothetical protein EOP05_22235 [Proteobacteria bacterium]|nr:MAG: hypothetical protein EOP05_22235 [Pseudomonadota bacterium]
MIANRGADYENESRRLKNFANLYASAPERIQTKTYVMPIAANLGLNEAETKHLYEQVASTFSLLTPMGGHDADPELYGEENRKSLNVVPSRDKFEIGLIKTYAEKSKGFIFAICRGHQMTSIALGYKLLQDLPTEAPSDVNHSHGSHGISLKNTAYGFLKWATGGKMSVEVNTLHHQAVLYTPGGPAQPAAYGPDGIVEGLEFKNGRGLTLQFHPELMDNALGRSIMHSVVRAKNRTIKRECRALFSPAA